MKKPTTKTKKVKPEPKKKKITGTGSIGAPLQPKEDREGEKR